MEFEENHIYLPWESDGIRFLEGDWCIYRGLDEGWYGYSVNGIDGNVECKADMLVEYGMAEYIVNKLCCTWSSDEISLVKNIHLEMIKNLGNGETYYLFKDGKYFECNAYYLVDNNLAIINDSDAFFKPVFKKAHAKEPKFDYSKNDTPWEEHKIYFYDYSKDGISFEKFKNGRGEHLYWVVRGSAKSVYKKEDLLRHGFAVTHDDYFFYLVKKVIHEDALLKEVKFKDIITSYSKVTPFIKDLGLTNIPSIAAFFEQLLNSPSLFVSMIEQHYSPSFDKAIANYRKLRKTFGNPDSALPYLKGIKEGVNESKNSFKTLINISKKVHELYREYNGLSFIHFIRRKDIRNEIYSLYLDAVSANEKFEKLIKIPQDKIGDLKYINKTEEVMNLFKPKSKTYFRKEFDNLIKNVKSAIKKFFDLLELMQSDEDYKFLEKYEDLIQEFNEFENTRGDYLATYQSILDLIKEANATFESIKKEYRDVL